MLRIAILFFAVSFLSACNTLTLERCQNVNWGEVGFETAMDGRPVEAAIQPEHRQCDRDYGVRPNFQSIKLGYKDGLKRLCTRNGGRELGLKGGSYRNTCSAEAETEFLTGYQLGRIEYAGNRINYLETEVNNLRTKLHDRDNRIGELESQVQSLRK